MSKKEKALQTIRHNGKKYYVIGKWMYNEGSELGAGGFGAVYKGIQVPLEGQPLSDDYVAIKLVEIREGIKNFENNLELESVRQEIQTLQQLDHPNIVQLIDVKKHKDNIYMVMEFCQHGDLEQFFKRKTANPKKLTELEIRFYFSQIIEAFKYLRKNDLIHRDIKPQNILVKNDVWKVADFGFAKKTTSKDVETDFRGTLVTLAPQVMLQNYNNKCDIYSLGATLYWILYNEFPYKETNQKKLIEAMEKNPAKCPKEPHYSEELKNILERMLIFDQDKRIDWPELFESKIFKQKYILETGQINVLNIINYDEIKEDPSKKIELWKGLNIDEIEQDKLDKAENKIGQQMQQIDDKAKINDTVFRLQKRIEFEKGKTIFLRKVFERVGHYSVNGRVILQKQSIVIKDLQNITRFGLYKYQHMCIKHIIDRLHSKEKQFDFTEVDWSYVIKSEKVQTFVHALQSDISFISLDSKEMNKVAKKYQDIDIHKQMKDVLTPTFWSNDYTYNVDFVIQLLLIIKMLIKELYPEIEKNKYSNLQNSLNISDTLYLVDDLLIVTNMDNIFEWNEDDIINFNTFLQQYQEDKTSQQPINDNTPEAVRQFQVFNQVHSRVKLTYEIFFQDRELRNNRVL